MVGSYEALVMILLVFSEASMASNVELGERRFSWTASTSVSCIESRASKRTLIRNERLTKSFWTLGNALE